MSFLRGSSTNLTCTALTFALGFANQALIARGLGAQGRGVLGLMSTSVLFGGMLFGEWLSRGNSFTVGRDSTRVGSVWSNTTMYCVLLAMLFVLAAALFATVPALSWLMILEGQDGVELRLSTTQLFLLAGLMAAVIAQRGYLAILLGRDRLTAYAVLPVLFIACYLGLNAIAFGSLAAGIDGVLVSWLAATAVAAVVGLAMTRSAGGLAVGILRSTFTVGVRGGVSATVIFLLFRVDVYLVAHFLGGAQLGVYMIAVILAEMMQRVPNIAGAVMLPKVLGGGDDDHVLSLAISRYALLFSLPLAAGVVLVAAPLIEWVFGAPFAGAYEPLVWMLPGLVASGFGSVLNTKLAGQGYPPVTLWAPAAALTANVALNLQLIPTMGLKGAALATSVAYVLWAVMIAVAYQRLTGAPWARFVRSR